MKEQKYIFDLVDNRFEFYYVKNSDSFFVFDKLLKTNIELEIKIRKYNKFKEVSELKQIRYYYPKPNSVGKDRYQKSVYEIMFKLFGDYEGKGGSQLHITDDICKKIIKKSYDDIGFLLGYTDMIQSEEPLLRKVYSYISNNGGVSKYIEFTSELGINTTLYYKDHKDVFLKSSFEFIFFSILHFNKIEYQYEPFKVGTYVPDFYIPKSNFLIEILGLYGRDYYFKRTIDKEKLYKSEGYTYKPIIVDRHHPKESIFKGCEEIFGKLKLPDFNDYSRKYILKSNEFVNNLKSYLSRINEGKLKVSLRKDKSGFLEKYRYYYKYVLENYGTIQIGIKELVGIPSTKFKSLKIEQYWKNIDYVKDELENVFKNEKRIPSKRECLIKYRKKYNIWNVYRFWGEKSLLNGGEFYEFVEDLKLKYGYRNIDLENKIEKKKKEIEFFKEIHRVVLLVYNDKLPINGNESLFTKYRPIYNFLFKNYGGVFYYIKDKIGYPPPNILRPKGYYKIDQNVKYELEENWKKFKRILGDTERLVHKDDNTYYNMIHILGINEFRKGGKYFKFIELLKRKYGYDDSIERVERELNDNLIIYLNGINDGKWNTKTKSSKELGLHGKYLSQVHKKFGNVFIGVKKLIGFPSPFVIRYHKYYDNIENCKYEITENIKKLGYLPSKNDCRKAPLLGNNTLNGVYQKYSVKEFRVGGLFYRTVLNSLKLYGRAK